MVRIDGPSSLPALNGPEKVETENPGKSKLTSLGTESFGKVNKHETNTPQVFSHYTKSKFHSNMNEEESGKVISHLSKSHVKSKSGKSLGEWVNEGLKLDNGDSEESIIFRAFKLDGLYFKEDKAQHEMELINASMISPFPLQVLSSLGQLKGNLNTDQAKSFLATMISMYQSEASHYVKLLAKNKKGPEATLAAQQLRSIVGEIAGKDAGSTQDTQESSSDNQNSKIIIQVVRTDGNEGKVLDTFELDAHEVLDETTYISDRQDPTNDVDTQDAAITEAEVRAKVTENERRKDKAKVEIADITKNTYTKQQLDLKTDSIETAISEFTESNPEKKFLRDKFTEFQRQKSSLKLRPESSFNISA